MKHAWGNFKIENFERYKHHQLVDELTAMLHEAYEPLGKKGLSFLATHQTSATTLARMDQGPTFLGFLSQKLVATITLVKGAPREPCGWYQKPEVYFFTQFAVAPSFQQLGFGQRLISHAEEFAFKEGARELALDTAEGAQELIAMYEKRQYRFIEYANWSVTNYRSVILSKSLQ